MKQILLEAPVFTIEAALKAAEYGIDRLELCSSFFEGGETPGAGLFSYLKENIAIPIYVMIRPRGGDFVYSDHEIEAMQREIKCFSSLGADGFVFGILNPDGSVDAENCTKLLRIAGEVPCTFHRAFDVCNDQEIALETIIKCGFTRVLTSGGKNNVKEGLAQIIRLLNQAGERIIIMPGGGMKPEFVADLRKTGYLREIHASCKMYRESKNRYTNSAVHLTADPQCLQKILTIDRNLAERFINAIH